MVPGGRYHFEIWKAQHIHPDLRRLYMPDMSLIFDNLEVAPSTLSQDLNTFETSLSRVRDTTRDAKQLCGLYMRKFHYVPLFQNAIKEFTTIDTQLQHIKNSVRALPSFYLGKKNLAKLIVIIDIHFETIREKRKKVRRIRDEATVLFEYLAKTKVEALRFVRNLPHINRIGIQPSDSTDLASVIATKLLEHATLFARN